MDLRTAPDGRTIAAETIEEGLRIETILLPTKQARKLSLKLIRQFSGLFGELLQEELLEKPGEKIDRGAAIKNAIPKLFEELQKKGGIFDIYEELAETFLPVVTAYRTENDQEVEYILSKEVRLNALLSGDLILESAILTFCLRANFKSFLDAFQSGRGAALFQTAAGMTKTE